MIAIYKEGSVYYTDQGKGNAIVLLHGFLENTTMWNDVVEELTKKNRVICIDLLGHGKSDCLGYIHTMEEMAEAVKKVLKELKIRRAIFIGHSMGGYVALAFAKKYKENVKGICLMNSTAQADTEERKMIRERAKKMAQQNLQIVVKMGVSNLFASYSREMYPDEIQQVIKQALQISLRGYMASNEGMRLRDNNEEVFAQIPKRVLIVGKKDPVLNYKTIVDEASRTNTELIELPNGHMSHIEDKKELIHALKNFLK